MSGPELPLTILLQGDINECISGRGNRLYCRYSYSCGQNWSVATGENGGETQTALRSPKNVFVFNHPLNISFQGSRPFGWPQIMVEVYGRNFFGNDMIVGYGAVHVPTRPGRHLVDIPLFVPASASLMQTIIGFFSGVSPEYIKHDFITGGQDREVTKTISQGKITLSLNIGISGLAGLDLKVQ
jgi:B9 domain-containing protein 1